MTSPPGYLGQSVGDFIDGLAAAAPAPAGGSAAALSVALAAALCAKSARLSPRQLTADRADLLTAQAEKLRTAAASLIDADALAYHEVIAAMRASTVAGETAGGRTAAGARARAEGQPERLAKALSNAAGVPMRVVELAADVAGLAARLAAEGNPRLRGDAITAAVLATAGARAAAALIGINLADAPDDDRPARAAQLLIKIERLATDLR